MKFNAHNILLPNGNKTIGQSNSILADKPVMSAIKRSINSFLPTPPEERKNIKVVDLGCMEGGYSTEFARMGFDTLGIDARKQNLLKAMYIKLSLNLPNLNFVRDDARNVAKYGKFDLTFCFGLLYHLNDPVKFLETLGSQTNKLLILHSFYAPEQDFLYDLRTSMNPLLKPFFKKKRQQFNQDEISQDEFTSYIQHVKNYRLSKLTENEGYMGRWFREWDEKKDKERVETMPGASYNNPLSFWLCKNEIIRALYQAGFDSVYEQHDNIGDRGTLNQKDYYGRVLLVAVKK